MNDALSVQLGHAQAGFMCTAQQGHQVRLALPIQQPPIVNGVLQTHTPTDLSASLRHDMHFD